MKIEANVKRMMLTIRAFTICKAFELLWIAVQHLCTCEINGFRSMCEFSSLTISTNQNVCTKDFKTTKSNAKSTPSYRSLYFCSDFQLENQIKAKREFQLDFISSVSFISISIEYIRTNTSAWINCINVFKLEPKVTAMRSKPM